MRYALRYLLRRTIFAMHHVHHECGGWPSWFSHVGLRILLSMVLLGISWIVFYQKMATTHGMWSSPTGLVALEVASAFIASVGHAVLLTYVMHCVRGSRCGALVAEGVKRRTRSATSVGFDRLMPEATHMHPTSSPSCMELQQRRTAGEVDGSDRIAHAPADEAPSISGGEYRDDVRPPTAHTLLHVKLWLVVLLVELAVTVGIAHLLNSNEHRLSQEITMALIHAGVDAIFVMVALAVMVSVHTIDTRGCSCCCRVVVVMVVVVGVLAAMVWLHLSHMHVGKQLRRGVTGALYDPCQAVGQQLSAKANTSIIMPALLSQGVCDFITGGRSCPRSSHRRPIGVVLEEEHVLLLPLHCPDGSLPSVHVERPDRNELHGGHRLTQPEYRWSSEAYQVEMAQRYHPAYGNYIFTYVGKTTRIASVQMHPRMFRRVVRVPRSSAEKKFRRSWPGVPNGALEVALGASSTYFISCGAEEELLLYPRRDGVWNPRPHMMLKEAPSMGMLPLPEEEDGLRCNLSHSRPPSNVLMLVIDSVSKQAFRRSLPKTTKWIESFNKKMKESAKKDQKRHDAAGEKHVPVHEVFESLGHVVHDHSTSGNFVPMLSGAVMCDYGQCDYNGRTMDLMDRTIFNRAKHAYGDGISTAWTGGLCEDTMNYMFGNQERNAGTGGRLRGIDRYLFNIMCHLDYSGIRNNFMGPYSNRHRCIEGRPVYDYVLNYTEILLRQQLRGYYAEEATSFLDLAYFVDGRELTQCVLSHLDESLVRFLNTLRKDLRFFADPANVLIIASDHGNQMGPYMHSAAGLVEKTMPTMLLFLHPTMLDRIDERKNRPAGTSRQNLARRLTQLSTPLDTYMTVGDLLGLPLEPTDFYMKRSSTPHSLFDERPESDMNPQCGTTCDWPREVSPSALEFCTPRNS